jgi:hypothetical protein
MQEGGVLMNSPFEYEYVDLDLNRVDKATVERAGDVQVGRASNGRGFIAVSISGAGVCYQVDLLCDNAGYCNCPDFVYRKAKEGLPCKHIVALDRFLGGRA